MIRLLIFWFINAVSVYATAQLLPGITIKSFGAAFVVALVLGLVNTLLKPVLVFFSIPFIIVTLGLFMLVINALLLELSTVLVSGFTIDSFWSAIVGSVMISVIGWILGTLINV